MSKCFLAQTMVVVADGWFFVDIGEIVDRQCFNCLFTASDIIFLQHLHS
jgi:hypothetical protein